MTRLLVASVVAVLVTSVADAQTRPDFSGTWKRDAARSDSATYPELAGPVTLTITQTADQVRIQRETARGAMTNVFHFAEPEKPAKAGAALARWRAETLVVNLVGEIRGQSVTTEQSMTLSANGNEMTVQSMVNVQHGYTSPGAKISASGRDVYVRVPANPR